MVRSRHPDRCPRAFTLVELLVVLTIVALIAALAVPAINKALNRGKQAASLSNIRQIGMSMLAYAADNDMNLPARSTGTEPLTGQPVDKWPKALYAYLPDIDAFIDPSDPLPANRTPAAFFTNNRNNSSYIFNGFNDLGTLGDATKRVNLLNLSSHSSTILFSKKRRQRGDFYMDVLEGASGNHVEVLDWTTYGNTLHYFFADGSARWLTPAEYRPELWLADKSFVLP